MSRPCQQCFAHAANYIAKKRHRKVSGRNDHDLCRRCWRQMMEATNVAAREWDREKRASINQFWLSRTH